MSMTAGITIASPTEDVRHAQELPEIRNWKWMEPRGNGTDPRLFGLASKRQGTHE